MSRPHRPDSGREPSVVLIGGGSGSFTLLQSLKTWTPRITALVNMADDGGSTGVLRDELGVLPPGDVRQCLVALSEAPQELRELFNFRFKKGVFEGHSFGNLFLSTVESMTENFADAVRIASDVLRITGRVVPVTLDDVRLAARFADGSVVSGEHAIDVMRFPDGLSRPELYLEPNAVANPHALQAILEADLVVIAPGDLYTSLGPLLVVDGIADVLRQTAAPIVYVCNLAVKPGHTTGFSVADHAAEIERFAGGPVLDHVLYNTAEPAPGLAARYEQSGEYLVEIRPEELPAAHYHAYGTRLLSHDATAQAHAGQAGAAALSLSVPRSFIRHDARMVTAALQELLARGSTAGTEKGAAAIYN